MKNEKLPAAQAKERIRIRTEKPADYKQVEELTRRAFWNVYAPGCDEHYLVHMMRSHPDFLPELAFVLELDGEIIGNIMYTKARLVNELGAEKEILTFGPIAIAPDYQRLGYGKVLMEHSFKQATHLGYDTIVIFGNPSNYVSLGFRSCKRENICLEGGSFPAAMLVKELRPANLAKRSWVYHASPVMQLDEAAAEKFDQQFEKWEKRFEPSQEEFYIYANSFIG